MTSRPPTHEVRVTWWRRPHFWLGVMVVGFFAVSVYCGITAFDNFQAKNGTDAGIITQAVASAYHGTPAPFFESYDCMAKLRCSLMLVHPGVVLYLAVPFYAAVPSTVTLFVLRSAVVAAAAVPLYWLTRQVTHSEGKALLTAGLFLVWAPLLSGDAFSLHLESLLPLELFTLAALWQARRFRLGLIVAAVSFLSFEIYPVFTFLVGLFFLFPYIERAVRRHWTPWRDGSARNGSVRTWVTSWIAEARAGWRVREIRYTVALLVSSVAAYCVLSTFMNVWGYLVLGVVSPAAHPGVAGVFYNSSTPGIAPLGTILTSSQTLFTAEYWLILYALAGFLPLLSPRALILSVPWVGYTFLTDSPRFTTIGSQYTMLAAALLFIGVAYAMVRVPIFDGPAATPTGPDAGTSLAPAATPTSRRRRARGIRYVWVAGLAVVVVANCLLMPINPVLTDLGANFGPPFSLGYFDHSLVPNPAIAWAERMVAVIPYGATVTAPSPYFLLVANDPHAYVFVNPHMNTSRLPFNVSAGPEFVLLEPSSLSRLGPTFENQLSDPTMYGLRGYVGYTTGGPLLLYERGYSAPATLYGPALPPTSGTYSASTGLVPGPAGRTVENATYPTGSGVASLPGFNHTGEVWSGPGAFLSPGNYTVELTVALTGEDAVLSSHASVLQLLLKGVGPTLVNVTLSTSDFVPGQWMDLSYNATVASPIANLSFAGFLLNVHAAFAVAQMSIRPA